MASIFSCCGPWGIVKGIAGGGAVANGSTCTETQLDGELHKCLDKVIAIYPGICTAALLSIAGDVIAHRADARFGVEDLGNGGGGAAGPIFSEDVIAAITSFKRVALQMASTLREADCPIVSISGDTHYFACYEVDPHFLLAIFSDTRSLESIDTALGDAQIHEIGVEIKTILA